MEDQIEAVRGGEPQPLVGVTPDRHIPGALRERLFELGGLGCVVFERQNLQVHRCNQQSRTYTPTDDGSSPCERNAKAAADAAHLRPRRQRIGGLPVVIRK